MKLNIFVGSLVLGLGLCTQSFGFDLLDRMLGMNGCGADTAKSCCAAAPSCGADKGCAGKGGLNIGGGRQHLCSKNLLDSLGSKRCCQKAGCADQGCSAKGGADKGCGLRGGNKGCANKGCAAAAPSCAAKAAPTCAAPAAAAPSCAAKAADPSCAAAAAPSCGADKAGCASKGSRQICRPGLLDRLMSLNTSLGCNKGCNTGCAAPAKAAGCAAPAKAAGCAAPAKAAHGPACGCDGHAAPANAPPVKGEAVPQPPAPVVDPSAYLNTQRRVVQASSLVR